MKKRGFSLAEVLITMSIVGILAALIMPNLVRQIQNKEIMASLSSIVTNLESAFTRAIEEEHADDLTGTTLFLNGNFGNHAAFIGNLKKYYTKVSGFREINGATYYGNHNTELHFMNANGAEDINAQYQGANGEWTIEISGGPVIFITPDANPEIDEATAFNQGAVIRDVLAELVIDANGAKKPNIVGRDVFRFYLASDGKLYPHGSREYSRFLLGNENNAWTGNVAGFSCQAGHLAGTWGCSARVVDEGYAINY